MDVEAGILQRALSTPPTLPLIRYSLVNCPVDDVHTTRVNSVSRLASANDATIRRWRVSGECVQVYNGHESFVYSVCILSSGNEFATTGEDRTLRIWGG